MNGRKAKELRRAQRVAVPYAPVLETGTTHLPSERERILAHPLGEHVGVYAEWERNMKRTMMELIHENRHALQQCTRDLDCTNSIHYPDCVVAQ